MLTVFNLFRYYHCVIIIDICFSARRVRNVRIPRVSRQWRYIIVLRVVYLSIQLSRQFSNQRIPAGFCSVYKFRSHKIWISGQNIHREHAARMVLTINQRIMYYASYRKSMK